MSNRWVLCVLAVAAVACAHDNSINEDNDVKNDAAAGHYYRVRRAYYIPFRTPWYGQAPGNYDPPSPQQYGAPYRQNKDAEAVPPSTAPDSYPVEPEHPAPAGSTVYKHII
ncbi:unnamed protein product [Bursaphelenchus okinawaensis]|uniref:Uncharacterized protein n=1 Tax=Bursaphelenchus okinawaensis TaxID=465554 RepID=A0A811KUE2_9BILA|nr:unnamed protein product [Bursaphelenchus okinawaensis]CAG9113398.1 unnamed protein product [Bursaphelenchus okinawaensis]